MQKKWLLVALAVGAAYFLYKGFNKVWANIEYGFTKMQLKLPRFTGNGNLILPVKVIQPIINKNAIAFPLDAIEGGLYYGNDQLATFQLPAPISIAANSTTDIIFDSELNLQSVGTEIDEILRTNQWLQALSFKGTATSAGVTFPFDHTVTIG